MTNAKSQIETLLHSRKEDLYRRIKYYLGKNLGKAATQEEILAETVCYFLEHPNGLETKEQSELYNIFLWKARRVVWDRVRKIDRFEEALQEMGEEISDPSAESRMTHPSPSLLLHRESKRQDLRRAIGLIPSEDQRRALWLMRIENRSLAEAAQTMGKSTQAVKKLIERGFRNLVFQLKSGGKIMESTGQTS